MTPTVKIFAQVGDQELNMIAEQPLDASDGPATVRATADLLRQVANHMDDILTLFQVDRELS